MFARHLRVFALSATLALAACFGPGTPEEQLKAIEEAQSQNLPMTEEQKTEFATFLKDGKEALAAGDKEKAGTAFDGALKIIKLAEDAALYNKAD